MATTASQLARAFGIVMRQIADLLTMLQDYRALAPNLPRVLDISNEEAMKLQVHFTLLKSSHGSILVLMPLLIFPGGSRVVVFSYSSAI